MSNTGRLIIARGLPGSGKSTWARVVQALDPDETMVVNRDATRKRLFGSDDQDYYACDPEVLRRKENMVTEANHAAIKGGVRAGMTVIVDDTNLPVRRCRELRAIAVREGAEVFVQDQFADVPLDECLRRNADRRDKQPVPEKVIRDMHARFIRGGLAPLPENDSRAPGEYGVDTVNRDYRLEDAVIVDIDGTLAIHGDRSPYDFSRVGEDAVNDNVAFITDLIYRAVDTSTKVHVIVMSGRSDECLKETQDWLEDNSIYHDHLYMRAADDKRADWQVKYDLFNKHVRGKYNVRAVFDDRNQVVKLWREMGLTCFQVAEGDF